MRKRKETRNIMLFGMGKIISIFGTAIYTFALGLYVLKETGSGLSFATTLAIGIIPLIVINPFAGVIADRVNKKKIVVSMDMLNGILLLGVYWISSIVGLSILMIYVTTFIMTAFTCFFSISFEAAKPNIVSDKRLMSINSISKIIDSVSLILGPMIGGMVFAFIDIKRFILLNGLSFIISSILEMFIDFEFNDQEKKADSSSGRINFVKEIKEGLRYIKERKEIMRMLSVFVALNFFLGYAISVPLPYIVNTVLKLTTLEFGIIESGFPVGMIIGAVLIKSILNKVGYTKLLKVASFMIASCMFLVGLPVIFGNNDGGNLTYLSYYFVTMVILGTSISFVDIPILYVFQKMIPERYRGRVLSIGMSIAKTVLPIALILSGLLINHVAAYLLPMSGGVLLFIIMSFSLRQRDIFMLLQ